MPGILRQRRGQLHERHRIAVCLRNDLDTAWPCAARSPEIFLSDGDRRRLIPPCLQCEQQSGHAVRAAVCTDRLAQR